MDNSSVFSLTSSSFENNQPIPASYTHKGDNTSPPLTITGVPEAAKSLALILHDPDAVNGDFVHWTMWDMPAATQSINADAVPVGAVQGMNGAGTNTYIGPAPPAGTGTHHYIFELYALDTALNLPHSTTREQLETAMANHIIAKAELIGLFDAD